MASIDQAAQDGHVDPAGRRTHYWVTFAVLIGGVSAFSLLQSLVSPALPTLAAELHTSQNTVTWALTGYLLSASICTPIMGRLGDIIGKEKMLVATLAALTVGSLVAALATSITVLIIARVIQGIGGGVLPLSFGIVRDEFPHERVTSAVGLTAALSAAVGGLGIVVAGPIISALNYHWLFWIPMIITALAVVAALVFIPESPVRTSGRISVLPAVLLSAWLVALLLGVSKGSDWGWGSGRVLGLFAAAVVLAVGWVVSETRARTPLIDMSLMRRRAVWTNNVVALLIGVALFAIFGFLPAFLQTPSAAGYGFGASITQSGVMVLPLTIALFVFSIVAARLAQRLGGKVLVTAGCTVGMAAMLLLALAHSQQWKIYLATTIIGAGFGLAFAAMSGLVVHAVPREQTGVATGMNTNIRTIGGSIGAAVMGSIVTTHLSPTGIPQESGYNRGFLMLAGGLLVGALASLAIPRRTTTPPDHIDDAHDEPEPDTGLSADASLARHDGK